jgi:dolichol-phosphate mannosyltransferase
MESNMSKNITIVLPTYNEAGNLPRLLQTLLTKVDFSKHRLSILVVDDNSPDGTGQIATTAAEKDSRIYVLSGDKAGLGKAYKRGFDYALSNLSQDVVVMMDSDFSHDPHMVPRLVDEIDAGYDYVIGSRYAIGGAIPGDWPLKRIINSRVANVVARHVGGIDGQVKDISGGFKAIRSDILKRIEWDKIQTSGYAFQMHLLHAAVEAGAKVAEIPITFIDRQEGQSKLKLGDVFEFLRVAYGLNPSSPMRQLVRFTLVGGCGIVVNLSVLSLLAQFTSLNLIGASALAIEVSILTNFLLHMKFTFREPIESLHTSIAGSIEDAKSSTSWFKQLGLFNSSSLATAVLSLAVFAILHTTLQMNYLVAQFIGIVAAFALNYQVSSRLIWRRRAQS